jgi:hypothetical protein
MVGCVEYVVAMEENDNRINIICVAPNGASGMCNVLLCYHTYAPNGAEEYDMMI